MLLLILLVLTGCSGSLGIGTTTSQRPALLRPAVQPDGAFWDAMEVSRGESTEGFLHLLSPGFLHASFIPRERIPTPTSQDEFDELRAEVERLLAAAAARNGVDMATERARLAAGYMQDLRSLEKDHFIEVGKPVEAILHQDEYRRAYGPNRAHVIVSLHPTTSLPEDYQPRTLRVNFIQDGYRWLIDSFEPDPRRGAYVWTR
jgi:hypothetical protein